MLSIFLIIAMLVFATLIFYAERSHPFDDSEKNDTFTTIPVGFWWAIITMTTVGYGDVYPHTPMGKVIGGLCALWGVLLVALTIPVISNNFTLFYLHARTREDIVPDLTKPAKKEIVENFIPKYKTQKYKDEKKKGFDSKALLIRVDSNSATEDGGIGLATQNSGNSIGEMKKVASNNTLRPNNEDEESVI